MEIQHLTSTWKRTPKTAPGPRQILTLCGISLLALCACQSQSPAGDSSQKTVATQVHSESANQGSLKGTEWVMDQMGRAPRDIDAYQLMNPPASALEGVDVLERMSLANRTSLFFNENRNYWEQRLLADSMRHAIHRLENDFEPMSPSERSKLFTEVFSVADAAAFLQLHAKGHEWVDPSAGRYSRKLDRTHVIARPDAKDDGDTHVVASGSAALMGKIFCAKGDLPWHEDWMAYSMNPVQIIDAAERKELGLPVLKSPEDVQRGLGPIPNDLRQCVLEALREGLLLQEARIPQI